MCALCYCTICETPLQGPGGEVTLHGAFISRWVCLPTACLFWHHLYFSPHITKQPCVQLQRNALISVSGEAALHFSMGGLASLNNLPRNEYFPMKYFSGITSCCRDLDQFRFYDTGRGSPANTGEGEAIAGLPC